MYAIKFYLLILLFILTACGQSEDPKLVFKKGNYEEAFDLWKPRASNGDAEAQNYLGVHYYLGLGTGKNFKEAVKWFDMAAKSGYPDAQRNLADMYHYGRGVPQDYYKAYIWYFAASQQGHENAKLSLENITGDNKLTPNQQMHAKIEANHFIPDPSLRFSSHDTYIDK